MTSYVPLVDCTYSNGQRQLWVGEVLGLAPGLAMRIVLDPQQGLACIVGAGLPPTVFPMPPDEQRQVMEDFRRWRPGRPLVVHGITFDIAQAVPLRITTVGTDGYHLGAGGGIWSREGGR